MSQFKTQEEAAESGVYIRKIQSFVKREGRLTKGQEKAIESNWETMGLEHKSGLLNMNEVFERSAPVVLEIGFGMGKSLVTMAKNEPDKDFIGIEVHRPGIGACLADAQEQGVTNLRVYEHDAVEVLADCIADGSLSRMQLFFPDPWHKKRHHKRRIVQPEFVEKLRGKLAIGGVFHMATDWENYAEHMLEIMSVAPGYKNLSSSNGYVPRPEQRPLTKFEQRGHRLGHGVWDLMFERDA
ncbi:tRNA (guanosine(46)-N7)-methyltransferase TrmB [Paraglaciecola polaris]|uniref:tRNA (guanine-N(7)-)-methyltransferase n=1 Tax=Paraglaciecola polaris LMG 21857 TaxID=1129793 RepID=K6ZRI3_9ALTE|nr:tRNA (guanosine(46)-N7)-methyltransferase TrmB [Paraglaciecola polaris]GAC32917.1 tRNA (guanine-N7-)-methyltransferase [Paraglaciecola polaris LMG 21857]|tara:strand:+ start:7686 stop:8405 length:720 start_codon:yes stop_codon:yes gene_type:complete